MKHYIFDEIEIGTHEEFNVSISTEQMEKFAKLSGDYNPMHIDKEYARKRGYKDRVVYGMLVSSFYSTLVGMYLPGENCLLNKCEVEYRKPVFVGDTLLVYGEVVDKRQATRRLRIKAKMTNQSGQIVNLAEITVSFTGD